MASISTSNQFEPRYYLHPSGSRLKSTAAESSISTLAQRRLASKAWTNLTITYDSDDAYRIACRIYSRLGQLPLRVNAPHSIATDSSARTVTVQFPNIDLRPLRLRLKIDNLPISTIQHLKTNLLAYVELLYNNGIAYKVTTSTLFLTRIKASLRTPPPETLQARKNTEWCIFLGGTQHLEHWSREERAGSAKWTRMMEEQLDRVEKLFASVEEDALGRELRALELPRD